MISISVTGLRELDWRLRMLAVRIRTELPETMQTIAETMAEKARDEIGREKPSWPPLAASTVAEKRRHGWTGRISETDPLLRTGKMRSSIRGESDALIAEVRVDAPGLWQERGTTRKPTGARGYRPPRPFLRPALEEVSPAARALLAETMRLAIEEV